MKFLFDLFPIILFFVAFKIWGIFTATAVAIVATLVQIAWVAFRHRKVDPMLWVSLGVVTVFGGATLVLHNDTFIKWKPTVLYWAFSVALIVSQLAFNKNLIEAMMGKQITLPHAIWGKLNIVWAVFFVLLGLVNLFVAYQLHDRPVGQFQAVRRDRLPGGVHRRTEFVAVEVYEGRMT